MVALKEDSSWNVLESSRKMCCAVWYLVTSWWIKILNRQLVPFFLTWVVVICRGKSNLFSLHALQCQCQAAGSWLSEPWTQLWWSVSLATRAFCSPPSLPMFYFRLCFGSLLGQKTSWDFWDGILNFSKQDHVYMVFISQVLQLLLSTNALGRLWFNLLLMMGVLIFSLSCTGISFACLVNGWEDRLRWNI